MAGAAWQPHHRRGPRGYRDRRLSRRLAHLRADRGVLIDQALRDEGTSYHYLRPAPFSCLQPHLRGATRTHWDHTHVPLHMGASWTTDAPFRDTAAMIATCRQAGILAVEMEAAALYALAETKQNDIVCFAQVTNQVGRSEEDFEKGEVSGSRTLLRIIGQTIHMWEHARLDSN